MNHPVKKPLHRIGYDFIAPPFLPEGGNEFLFRDRQYGDGTSFRGLNASEIEVLVKNENQADDWTNLSVREEFNPRLVKNCHFYGRIRIGALQPYYLEHHELRLPVGLYHSTIVSCDIGDNVAIRNVDYLGHFIIGNEVILFNINEMQTTNHAKFGNGILKEGEAEETRIWLEICNENAGRKVIPFDGMTPADAWLWAKFRDRDVLMERFREMTEAAFDPRRGYYGTVGDRTVIKDTRILKDVKVGSHAYIKGGNKLKNLTINSSEEAPSQIGEGVEMVNGIMGYGSKSFYGVKAVRFVMGENTTLKYGARLINSLLGDNSTISCCEVLNSLIFPAHEQHHNNSFLVAGTILGQSNIAAGATLGSNHNSRAADGEVIAGRGFWPGLCVNLKYNSRFASFCLLAKGSYPSELNIPLPFALVSESENCLQVMPAYWWLYNMYALVRNARKYADRDRRHHRVQAVVFDFLAPDTVTEIFHGLHLLEIWTAKAWLRKNPGRVAANGDLASLGRRLLNDDSAATAGLTVLGEGMENADREVRILKVAQAWRAYHDMLHYYCMKTLIAYGETTGKHHWTKLSAAFRETERTAWINLGGQLVRRPDLEQLLQQIETGEINSWNQVHDRYHRLWDLYPEHNAAHAFACLLALYERPASEVNDELWAGWLEKAIDISRTIARRTRVSREKDYANPFRGITYETEAEMEAVLGRIDENAFIMEMETEVREFEERIRIYL